MARLHGDDATLAEINPLVITRDGRLMALDGKIIIDDSALYRHPDLTEMRDLDAEAPAETEARKFGLTYIKLDGDIGCMVSGAGLAMTTMDIVKLFGGNRPTSWISAAVQAPTRLQRRCASSWLIPTSRRFG